MADYFNTNTCNNLVDKRDWNRVLNKWTLNLEGNI